jgi:hypothetical protein
MINVSAEFKKSDIDNLLKNFSGSLVRKAVRSALDRTGTWGKKYIVDDVERHFNVNKSVVFKHIKVKRTTQNKLSVEIDTTSSRLPFVDLFKYYQDSVGVKVLGRKDEEPYSYPHAFINIVSGYKKPQAAKEKYPKRGEVVEPPTSIRPYHVEWERKRKQLQSKMRQLKKIGKPGKQVIMMRIGKDKYPTTGKPGRGLGFIEMMNRTPNREKRDSDLTNHLYKELEEQIAKRTLQQVSVPELE